MLCDMGNNQQLLLYLPVRWEFYGIVQVCSLRARPCHLLWWSGGKPRLIEHVQPGARGGLGVHRGLLLDHLHL